MKNQGRIYQEPSADEQEDEIRSLLHGQSGSQYQTQRLLKPRRFWFWLKILGAIVSGLFFINSLINSYQPISLRVQMDGLGTLAVTNIGTKPITIKNAIVNDRKDCPIGGGIMFGFADFKPRTLDIGEKIFINSGCNIIRVTLDTDLGSVGYDFKR